MNPLSVEKILFCKLGEGISATGKIPEESEFFKDHFPGFPVLPGVLALEMLKQTAECYLQQQEKDNPVRHFLKQIRATKFHQYLKPGDCWTSELKLTAYENHESHWEAKLFNEGKLAVSAKLVLAPSQQIRQEQSTS